MPHEIRLFAIDVTPVWDYPFAVWDYPFVWSRGVWAGGHGIGFSGKSQRRIARWCYYSLPIHLQLRLSGFRARSAIAHPKLRLHEEMH
jgi:hypothetical protein